MLHKLAAIKIVRELELKIAALGFDRKNPDGESGKLKKVYKQELIDIAVRQGKMSFVFFFRLFHIQSRLLQCTVN